MIPAEDDDGAIVPFNGTNDTDSFNFKTKITGKTVFGELFKCL